MIALLAALATTASQVAPVPAPVAAGAVASDAADRLAAARELNEVMGVEKQYRSLLTQLIPVMSVQVFDGIRNNVQVPIAVRTKLGDPNMLAEAQRTFAAEVAKEFQARYAGLKEATAREYVATFTAAELRQLIAFYRTPLGQKVLTEMPGIQQKLVPIGMVAGREAGSAALKTTVERLALDTRPTSS